MMGAKVLIQAMAAFVGLIGMLQLAAPGADDPPPPDLSQPRLTVPTPRDEQARDAEGKALGQLLRTRPEIIVIEGMPGVRPPIGARPADPDRASWTRPAQLRAWFQKAGLQLFEVGPIRVKVVVGHDAWRLDEADLDRLVKASVVAQAEGKSVPPDRLRLPAGTARAPGSLRESRPRGEYEDRGSR
ncbi:MAG: hypothetical protein WBX00_09845 [Isosphaeraceae bacterium]